MNKKLIRLTEQDLHRIVKESVKNILNEMSPELLAAYSNGRHNQAMAQQDPKTKNKYLAKAQARSDAAVNACNRDYGRFNDNDFKHDSLQMHGGYQVYTNNYSKNSGADAAKCEMERCATASKTKEINQQKR